MLNKHCHAIDKVIIQNMERCPLSDYLFSHSVEKLKYNEWTMNVIKNFVAY